MSNVNNQSWVQSMNNWLKQPGQDTQANIDAIKAQAKAAGIDPGEIGGSGDSKASAGEFGPDDGGYDSGYESGGDDMPPPDQHPADKPVEEKPKTETVSGDDGKQGPAGGKYDKMIQEAAEKYNVPPALIKSVIQQESGGDPNAVNGTSGCTGLMQLKPEYFGQDGADLKDPKTNIDRGTKELARLLEVKGGDPVAALAGYNLGEFANIDTTVPGQNGLTGREYAQQVLDRFQ